MSRAFIYRILALIAIFLGCAFANSKGYFYYFNHAIAEKRMELSSKQSSGTIALLEIDNKSLTAIGLWPWKRSIYGEIIEKTFAAGAEELAFDIDFSSHSSPEEDTAFQRALENAEGPVTLAIFQQHDIADFDRAEVRVNHPIEELSENAWLATVNVLADADGVVRSFPLAQKMNDGELYPSLTSVLGGAQTIGPYTFIVDYSIDPETIPTYSVIDLINGTLPADALKNRKVLIGAGAAELRDTITVPVYGMLSGPKLQLLAAESLLQGRSLAYPPLLWTRLLCALSFLLITVIALSRRFDTFIKLALLALISLSVEIVGYVVFATRPLLLQTGAVQTAIALSGFAIVLLEIRFKDILLNLSHKRSKSISELLETVVSDSLSGILIVEENGRILEISRKAKAILIDLEHPTEQGSNFRKALPKELTDLLSQGFAQDTFPNGNQTLQSLSITRNGATRYFEYSITPSLITSEQDAEQKDTKVITLLFHDVTEAQLEKLRLEYLADHDHLTDLLNKNGFCAQTDNERQRQPSQNTLVFVAKAVRTEKITQSLGADYTDLLMQQIAKRLTNLGQFEVAGCTEQREFLLSKMDARENEIEELTKKIQICLETPFSVRGHTVIIGGHVGIADFKEGGQTATEVVTAASVALHRARETGEQQLFYSSNLAADVVNKQVLEREIVYAQQRNEFELYYQPQANLKSGLTIGCEALIRWNHRELGLIRPDRFIPIVEETGMIADLGRWILETACRDAMQWPEPVVVAVNVSAVQFMRSDILADIRHALALSGLPRERLNIEITESLFIADPEAIIKKLDAIRDEGIKIALDDFGTGYSSLSYIHQFPLDKIKIDRAFVKDLPVSHDSLAVINAVTALAHGFDMTIVAEGMENEQQAEVLRIAGCHIGQGFFFGKPMPQDAFAQHLLEQQQSVEPAHSKATA